MGSVVKHHNIDVRTRNVAENQQKYPIVESNLQVFDIQVIKYGIENEHSL